jgi:hypothetical protein
MSTISFIQWDTNDVEQKRLLTLATVPFDGKFFVLSRKWLDSWLIGKWAAGPIRSADLLGSSGNIRGGLQEG